MNPLVADRDGGISSVLATEIRRCLHRRLVWVLVALALLASAVMAVLVLLNTAAPDPRLAQLAPSDGEDSFLMIALTLLLIGALLGGASMSGAEWRAGTIGPMLLWEPRRRRVAMAKMLAPAIVAVAVSMVLLVVFVLALVPGAVDHGSTADIPWARAMSLSLRGLALIGAAAAVGSGVALLARNTAATLVGAFVYLNIFEQAVGALLPTLKPWLLISNAAPFLTGEPLDGVEHAHGPVGGGIVLAAFLAAIVALSTISFARRDVGS